MKIIFWGTPEFAIPTLAKLVDSGSTILAVVTQQDSLQGRNRQKMPSAVKAFALEKGIPVLDPLSPNKKDFIQTLRALSPDVMVLIAYGKILRQEILDLAPHGILNIHFSLLPKYRGASPILAAMLAGESETGVSVMKIVPEMDRGPVCSTASLPILPSDTRGDLEKKLGEIAAPLLVSALRSLENGSLSFIGQDESKASYCGLIRKEDGSLPWDKDALYLTRFIRAMSPWPNAHTLLYKKSQNTPPASMIVLDAKTLEEKEQGVPGTIHHVSNVGLDVFTGAGSLRILALQKAGKKPMPVAEFLRGNPLEAGDFFSQK